MKVQQNQKCGWASFQCGFTYTQWPSWNSECNNECWQHILL